MSLESLLPDLIFADLFLTPTLNFAQDGMLLGLFTLSPEIIIIGNQSVKSLTRISSRRYTQELPPTLT